MAAFWRPAIGGPLFSGWRVRQSWYSLFAYGVARDPMLVLASASPARRRLLEQAAIPHRVRVSGIDEDAIADPDPRLLVVRLAEAKARAVAELPAGAEAEGAGGVLGCDSLLTFEGEVFGKPADANEAIGRWQRMAGGWAELHTGHCLLGVGGAPGQRGARRQTVTTRVHFAALSAAEIEAYVATGEPLACAGGFALEGRGGALVERIDGCYSNVIGLSLPLLRRWLADR
jgi:septum formation protein